MIICLRLEHFECKCEVWQTRMTTVIVTALHGLKSVGAIVGQHFTNYMESYGHMPYWVNPYYGWDQRHVQMTRSNITPVFYAMEMVFHFSIIIKIVYSSANGILLEARL